VEKRARILAHPAREEKRVFRIGRSCVSGRAPPAAGPSFAQSGAFW